MRKPPQKNFPVSDLPRRRSGNEFYAVIYTSFRFFARRRTLNKKKIHKEETVYTSGSAGAGEAGVLFRISCCAVRLKVQNRFHHFTRNTAFRRMLSENIIQRRPAASAVLFSRKKGGRYCVRQKKTRNVRYLAAAKESGRHGIAEPRALPLRRELRIPPCGSGTALFLPVQNPRVLIAGGVA
jgi:hypothetical protein